MKQLAVTSVGRLQLPERMLRAYKHSTNEHRALFNETYEELTSLGLEFYSTNCPDLRAKHPQNDLVFVVLGFQEVAGTRVEVRVDSVPRHLWISDSLQPTRIAQYYRKSRARWAVYHIRSERVLGALRQIVQRLIRHRAAWGNSLIQYGTSCADGYI